MKALIYKYIKRKRVLQKQKKVFSMLVNSIELFKKARQGNYAIPATNFIDLDSARTYVQVAEQRKLPLILAFAQSHRHIISLEEAALIGRYLGEKATVPIVLHLDHGEDIDFIERAIKSGFTSVMIDASQKEFDDNIKLSSEVVNLAHLNNISVEAELGHVGSNAHSSEIGRPDSIYTDVQDVISFVEATKVDSLAISIGTAHGLYKGTPKINFDRLHEIAKLTDVPLVLHGGSSSGDSNLERCATEGMSKINIYTDFLVSAMNHINSQDVNDYVALKQSANEGMAKVLNHYYDVFHTKA